MNALYSVNPCDCLRGKHPTMSTHPLVSIIRPALEKSDCFRQELPGGPYGHYVLRIPGSVSADILALLAEGALGPTLQDRAMLMGLRGVPRLLGFPVEWDAGCDLVELIPLRDATTDTLVGLVKSLLDFPPVLGKPD